MNETQAKAAVNAYFLANFPTAQPGVRFDLENVGTTEPSPGATWVRMRMQSENSVQETLGPPGARQYRRDQAVWCWCRVPGSSGTLRLTSIVDTLRAMYEGVSYSGISPRGAVRTVTRGASGQWYEVVVIAPIMYTETR